MLLFGMRSNHTARRFVALPVCAETFLVETIEYELLSVDDYIEM